MSPRRAGVLAQNLPAGAMTWTVVGLASGWTHEAHLLAGLFDQLAGANWQRAGGQGLKPDPLPRPGDALAEELRRERIVARAQRHQRRMNAQRVAEAGEE